MTSINDMLIDPTKDLTPEQLAQFGTIVTADGPKGQAQTTAPVEQQPVQTHTISLDQKIKTLETPVELSLKLTGEQHERLLRLCSNNSQSRLLSTSNLLSSLTLSLV